MGEFIKLGDLEIIKKIIKICCGGKTKKIFEIGTKMKNCLLRRKNELDIQLILNIGQLLDEHDKTAITPEMICKNCAKKNECCKKK